METAVTTDSASNIAVADDGMPADKNLRRIAVTLKVGTATFGSGFLHNEDQIKRAFRSPKQRELALLVRHALIDAGTIRMLGGYYQFYQPARLETKDPASRQANYEAVARTVGDRLGQSQSAKDRASSLFVQIRDAYGVHRQTSPAGRLVIIPKHVAVDKLGAYCAEALVILVSRRGLRILEAPKAAFKPRETGQLVGGIDLGACLPSGDDKLLKDLHETYVSTYTSQEGVFPFTAGKLLKASLGKLFSYRKQAEEMIGEPITPDAWKSFVASAKRTKNLRVSIRRVLFASLDRDIRLACMRHPMAGYAIYDWFCGDNDTQRSRRLQASAAYPILTLRLPDLADVVDNGLPMSPALSELTGIPEPALRRLVGVTWQRLGRDYPIIADRDEGGFVPALMRQTPADLLPTTRKDWQAFAAAASMIGRTTGFPAPAGIVRAASKDWTGFQRLIQAGLENALSDTAKYLERACSGVWKLETLEYAANFGDPSGPGMQTNSRAIILELASGGGLKPLATFNHRWHATQGWRTAAQRKVRRDLLGSDCLHWPPLTATQVEPEAGSFKWLCDEDQLAVEGLELRHCVGAYAENCWLGHAHIAAIRDAAGNRSTAEFHLAGKTIKLAQHQAVLNSEPAPGNVEIVGRFLQAARTGKVKVNPKARRRRKHRPGSTPMTREVEIPLELRRQLVEHYAYTLGRAGRLTLEDWQHRTPEAIAPLEASLAAA